MAFKFISRPRLQWLSFIGLVGCVQAQQVPSLEDLLLQETRVDPNKVEVSASARYIQNQAASPQVTYVLTDVDIRRFNLRDLSDILSFLPGLHVSSDSTLGYLTARGIGRPGDFNSRLLFLVDGNRVNDNVYDAGLIGSNFFLDTELIERVEFSPGASSALYGSTALLGVINIVTKRADKLAGVALTATTDSQSGRNAQLVLGHRTDSGHEGWISLSHSARDDITPNEPMLAEFIEPYRYQNTDQTRRVALTYRYQRLQVQAAQVLRGRHMPQFLLGGFGEIGVIRSEDDNYFVSVQQGYRLNGAMELFAHVSNNGFNYRSYSPTRFDPRTVGEYLFDVSGRWHNLDLLLSYQPAGNLHWLFGVDIQRDYRQGYQLSVVGSQAVEQASTQNTRGGLFLQNEWHVSPEHTLISGLRYDQTAQGIHEWTPKLAWLWQPASDKQLKLSYGSAFRAANEYESEVNRFWQLPLPNSEKVYTLEASWSQSLTDVWHWSSTAYRSRIDELITALDTPFGFSIFYNERPVYTHGLESVLTAVWQDNRRFEASLSFNQSHYLREGRLTNSPDQLWKLSYSQPVGWPSLLLSYRLYGASNRLGPMRDIPGYVRHDLSLTWQMSAEWQWNLGVKNLTDVVYLEAPLAIGLELLQPRRMVELTVHWSPDL